jgi:hypothetical protein
MISNLMELKSSESDSLREDYEIVIIDGMFEVNYSGHCSDCNYTYSYKKSIDFITGKVM